MRLPLHSPRFPLTENHTTVTGAPAVGFGLAVTDTTDSEGQRQAKRRGRQRGGDSIEEDENFFPSNEFQGAVPGFVYKKVRLDTSERRLRGFRLLHLLTGVAAG